MAGLTIDDMRLAPNAKAAAQLVLKAHPEACFTSGRRDVMDQARVMAKNVVQYGPIWLQQTYRDTRMVKLLMTYTEENPEDAADPRLLATGFYEMLQEHYAGQLTKFPHVRGDAFDLAWPVREDGTIDRPAGEAICRTIESLPVHLGLQLLLKREGSHDVIHAQFNHYVDAA